MVLAELAAFLETAGIGTRGTNLFYGILPDTPDACVSLYEYGGLPNEPDLGTPNTRLEFPSLQVVCRGVKDDYDTPRLKAQAAVTALTAIANQTIGGVFYLAVQPKSAPAFGWRDDNFRVVFVTNYQVTKKYSAT